MCLSFNVPCVPMCSRANVSCVLTCSLVNVPWVLTWSRANVPYVLKSSRVSAPCMLTWSSANVAELMFCNYSHKYNAYLVFRRGMPWGSKIWHYDEQIIFNDNSKSTKEYYEDLPKVDQKFKKHNRNCFGVLVVKFRRVSQPMRCFYCTLWSDICVQSWGSVNF